MSPDSENPYFVWYKNQPIHQDLRYAGERIINARLDDLDSAQRFRHARAGRVIAYLRALLDAADAELISPSTILNVNGLANSVRGHIDAYVNNTDPSALQQTENALNELLFNIRILPMGDGPLANIANDANVGLAESALNALNRVIAKADSTVEKVENLKERIAAHHADIESAKQTIESQKARLDQAITSYQATFSQSETERTRLFNEQNATWESRRQEQAAAEARDRDARDKELQKQVAELLNQFESKAAAHIVIMEKTEADTKRIFNVVGEVAQTGEYRNVAESEGRAADRFRLFAIVMMILMAGAAGTAFWYSLTLHEVDWKLFGFRLGTAAILAIPAFYAAQESSKHREREQFNRRLHLELAAIDAYLALLPEAKKQEIKASLTEKFFGREHKVAVEDTKSAHLLIDVLGKAVDNLTKARH